MRETLKAVARALATIVALPWLASYWLRAAVMGQNRALEGSTQSLALLPGVVGQYVRRAFLTRVLAECHHTVTVEFGTLFSKAGARLEENVYIGPRCHLGLVHIGKNTLLGPAVHVPSGATTHGTANTDVAIRDQPGQPQMVHIGSGSWIGSAAVVMADVGSRTIVGAGAVVTTSLPDGVMAAGVPARVMKQRS